MSQIFETGNAPDVFASLQAPQDDHQTAVSNRQIGGKHGAPIRLVFAQSSETRPGRRDEKTSVLKHRGNGFIHIAVEELKAKNLAGRKHWMTIDTPNQEIFGGSMSSTVGK